MNECKQCSNIYGLMLSSILLPVIREKPKKTLAVIYFSIINNFKTTWPLIHFYVKLSFEIKLSICWHLFYYFKFD